MGNIGFVGMGNMGYAIAKGLVNKTSSNQISFHDIDTLKMDAVSEELGIKSVGCNKEVILQSKYIILAVKPQFYETVLEKIKSDVDDEKIIITIAPGIKIDKIKNFLGNNVKVVRSMPNTPALVGEGMSVITFSDDEFSEEEVNTVMKIFGSIGEVEILKEYLLDAVVPISGSSPAYVYMFIEALADGGVSLGLPRNIAYKLAAQSVLGSAKMVLDTNKHPGQLKDEVCSPGGTTIEAVASLEKNGFRGTILEAVNKCYNKTQSFN